MFILILNTGKSSLPLIVTLFKDVAAEGDEKAKKVFNTKHAHSHSLLYIHSNCEMKLKGRGRRVGRGGGVRGGLDTFS